MYLISAYFDEKTNRRVNRYIEQIAEKTGNAFMTDNKVPAHLTILSVEARNGEQLIPCMEELQEKLHSGRIHIVSVGMLLPYVIYVTPVLNEYLQNLSLRIYDSIPRNKEISVGRYYKPMQWLPHITLGKTLTKEQMQKAFNCMQDNFSPFEGEIVSIGLAKTNPHEDILKFDLKGGCTNE